MAISRCQPDRLARLQLHPPLAQVQGADPAPQAQLPDATGHRLGEQADAAPARVEEAGVVAHRLPVEPEGAVHHVLEVRPGHEPPHPLGREVLGVGAEQLAVVRVEEVPAQPLAEARQRPVGEAAGLRRLGASLGLQKPQQAVAPDRGRQPEGVDLDRVRRHGPGQGDPGSPRVAPQLPAQPQRLDARQAALPPQVQEVPGEVEVEAVPVERPAGTAHLVLPLQHQAPDSPAGAGGPRPKDR